MLKTIALTAAIGAMAALVPVGANAMPLAPSKQMAVDSNVTLVRDGCGRGKRFSHSRDHCVWADRDYRHHRSNEAAETVGAFIDAIGGHNNNRGHHNNRNRHHGHQQHPGADGQDD